jgi:hypothetical protein
MLESQESNNQQMTRAHKKIAIKLVLGPMQLLVKNLKKAMRWSHQHFLLQQVMMNVYKTPTFPIAHRKN